MAATDLACVVDGIVQWVADGIAQDLEFYVPAPDGAVDVAEPGRAHPSVFPLFVPSVERLKAGEYQAPSIAVQITDVEDDVRDVRDMAVRLVLTVWSPGRFEGGAFVRDMEGWRETFNGVGAIASAVENAETIAGCAVNRSRGVSFGLFSQDRKIPDLYPYWMGQVDFRLRRSPQGNKRFEDLL